MDMHPPLSLVNAPETGTDEAILRRWGLDGGDLIDRPALDAQLTRLLVDETPPPEAPDQLIEWIRLRYHQSHRDVLETAIAMANVAETAHAGDDVWPHGLIDHLIDLYDELEAHQLREDAVIFPAIVRGGEGAAGGGATATAEHDGLKLRLEHLSRRTKSFTAPAHACPTWRLLYLLCRKLNSELRERMALETAALLGRDIRESTEDSGCSAAM